MEVISDTARLLRSASFLESVEVNLPFVVRVGGHHEPPRFDRQQVVSRIIRATRLWLTTMRVSEARQLLSHTRSDDDV